MKCVIVDCGPLEDIEYGHVNFSEGTGYGQVALYTCNSGYGVVGDEKRQCQSNGLWSGFTPVCKLHGEFIVH